MEYYRKETKKEIDFLLSIGVKKVPMERLKDIFSQFGLTICMDKKNYLHKYFNTSNENNYLEATTSLLDKEKISIHNTQSKFYKEHMKPCTEIGKEIQELRKEYFTVLRSGHILSL